MMYDRNAMLATSVLQEAFTLAPVNHVFVMDIRLNVAATLAIVWLVFMHS